MAPGNPLVPSLSGRLLSLDGIFNDPSRLNDTIANLTSQATIAFDIFQPVNAPVLGGALAFTSLLPGANFTDDDLADRQPGAEYFVTGGDDIPGLAPVQALAGKISIFDEELTRVDTIAITNRVTRLSNTLAKNLDQRAINTVEAGFTAYSGETGNVIATSAPDGGWESVITEGPLSDLTPNSQRPAADFAHAGLVVQLQNLGLKDIDTLILHPTDYKNLRVAYGDNLSLTLESAGISKVKTSVLMAAGNAYALVGGAVGRVGFERPQTTEVVPDRAHGTTWLQVQASPAFALTTPGAVVKITGI